MIELMLENGKAAISVWMGRFLEFSKRRGGVLRITVTNKMDRDCDIK